MPAEEKYHIGDFEITDAQAGLKFTGVLHRENLYVKPNILLLFSKFHGKELVSYKFSTIKARSFCKLIESSIRVPHEEFLIYSGGNKSSKHIALQSTEISLKLSASSGSNFVYISMDIHEALSLCDEIIFLIEQSVDSCYKLQRVIERKKGVLKGS